jgi:tRNA pseudouridine38/39 synthase
MSTDSPNAAPAPAPNAAPAPRPKKGNQKREREDIHSKPFVKKAGDREFDWAKYPKRHIALRLSYHGQAYDGSARQENTDNTIEWHLFQALLRLRLVPEFAGDETSPAKFARCGRTDKGVSALGNCVSLVVRGAKFTADAAGALVEPAEPLPYMKMLNRVLPAAIRITAWCFVPDSFDARFSCKFRVYRYFFYSVGLDVDGMAAAAADLLGEHDFRNFCKMDVVNVVNFVREIQHVAVVQSPMPSVCYLEIRGNAFLYHQIRCIMAILFMVGNRLEDKCVVKQLLDVKALPAKPCYGLASDAPLVLWDCGFDPAVVSWVAEPLALDQLLKELHEIATEAAVRSMMAGEMRVALLGQFGSVLEGFDAPTFAPAHQKLLLRPVMHTMDQLVDGLSEKKKARRTVNMSHKGKTRDRADLARPEAMAGDDGNE